MSQLIIIFGTVYVLNTIPAFAPPTWMALSFIGFNQPQLNSLSLAVAGAFAATFGRITLALMSQHIIRNKLLNENTKQNIDVLRDALERHKGQTMWGFFGYSFTPLPTNHLFIAYGLTTLSLRLIAVPFFVGRLASYIFWISLVRETYGSINTYTNFVGAYLSIYFIVTQIVLLLFIYLFAKVDWKSVLDERKFKWLKKK